MSKPHAFNAHKAARQIFNFLKLFHTRFYKNTGAVFFDYNIVTDRCTENGVRYIFRRWYFVSIGLAPMMFHRYVATSNDVAVSNLVILGIEFGRGNSHARICEFAFDD